MGARKHPKTPESAAGTSAPSPEAEKVPAVSPPAEPPPAAIPPAPPTAAELEALRAKAAECDAWKDTAHRVQADFNNYQNRMRRDRDTERKYGSEALCRALLPTLDSFEKAIATCSTEPAAAPILEGMRLIHRELMRSLEQQGVKRLDTVGLPFDAARHEVVTVQESAAHPAGTVVSEIRGGFLLHDRVLRVAQVIVSKPPSPPATPATPAPE